MTNEQLDDIAIEVANKEYRTNFVRMFYSNETDALEVKSIKTIVRYDSENKSNIKRLKGKQIEAKKTLNRNKPLYCKQDLLRCSNKPNSIKYEEREDGKAYPENIRIDKEEASDLIRNLNPLEFVKGGNYVETVCNTKPPADVYKKFYRRKYDNKEILIYIKLYIKDNSLVNVISFHEQDED